LNWQLLQLQSEKYGFDVAIGLCFHYFQSSNLLVDNYLDIFGPAGASRRSH